MVRIARLRRAAGRGVDRLYTAVIRPCTEYGAAIHGVSPTEMESLERLTARGLAPISKGVSRTANMVYMQEPLMDPMLACINQFLRSFWRSRHGEADALPVGGGELAGSMGIQGGICRWMERSRGACAHIAI